MLPILYVFLQSAKLSQNINTETKEPCPEPPRQRDILPLELIGY